MNDVFRIQKQKFRGAIHRATDPALEVEAVGSLSLDKRTDGGVRSELINYVDDVPPCIPYSTAFCSPNTYKSCGTVQPLELRKVLVTTLESIPVDVQSTNLWDMECVFYPNEEKTSFLLKLFDHSAEGEKGSCLVEMQMVEGDRFAFDNLCTHVQRVTALDDAFKTFDEGFGFDSSDDTPVEVASTMAPYEHATWKPLPLPVMSETCSNMEAQPTGNKDMSLFAPAGALECEEMPSVIEVLAMNTRSPFADIRRNGWQELAKATAIGTTAQSLLAATLSRQTGIQFIASALLDCTTDCEPDGDGLLEDLQRCVLKTLSNVAAHASPSQLQEIGLLKQTVISLAGSGNSIETRAIAVKLIERLMTPGDLDYRATLETCSAEKSRFSLSAKSALEGLGSLVLC